MKDAWNPDRYHRFQRERRRPFFDLLSLVHRSAGKRVVDLGCGTGDLTRVFHHELDADGTLGLDRSPAMLEQASPLADPNLQFEQADIADFARQRVEPVFDLVFSNAALHWVDDHARLLEDLRERLAPGGQLAVQVPRAPR